MARNMVVKQTLRAVANFGHQTLGLKWLQLLHQMESLLETTNKIMYIPRMDLEFSNSVVPI